MKQHVTIWSLMAGFLLCLQPVLAQETTTEQESKIVITKTIKDADGSEITITKQLDGEKALSDLWQAFREGKHHTEEADDASPATEAEEVLFLFRRSADNADEELREVRIFSAPGNDMDVHWKLQEEKDPCRVFIGVRIEEYYRTETGVRVRGVIEGTPADKADLQGGDIILEMDGQPVNNIAELIAARNEHDPGDYFRLKVLRGDEVSKVRAQFNACEQESDDDASGALEPPVVQDKEIMALELKQYKVFPNPSFGQVQLQFEADAVPTTVQLTDVTGKVVHTEQLNSFNGTYNRTIDLKGAVPGTIVVSVRQGDKVVAKQLLLLNRA